MSIFSSSSASCQSYRPLSSDAEFARIASILRVSSPSQLDLPKLHQLARKYLETLVPGGEAHAVYNFHPDFLEEALEMSVFYEIKSV